MNREYSNGLDPIQDSAKSVYLILADTVLGFTHKTIRHRISALNKARTAREAGRRVFSDWENAPKSPIA